MSQVRDELGHLAFDLDGLEQIWVIGILAARQKEIGSQKVGQLIGGCGDLFKGFAGNNAPLNRALPFS